MYCKKCGSNLQNDAELCQNCGEKVIYEDYEQNDNNYINDEELIDAYIGKNANKIKNKRFSFSTFFFGVVYFFYRKMELGLVWFALNIITNYKFGDLANELSGSCLAIIFLIPNIVFAFMFKNLYMNQVKKDVDLIKKTNAGKTRDELIKLCKKKGGTSNWAIVYGIIVYTVYIVLMYIRIFD